MNKNGFIEKVILQHNMIKDYEKHPFNLPYIKQIQSLDLHENVTFFVGENGAGKSTLLEAIAISLGFSIEGGTKSIHFKTHKNNSPLHKYLKIIKTHRIASDFHFLRAESLYNILTYLEGLAKEEPPESNFMKRYRGMSLHNYSHGETFLIIILEVLKGNGLYIFDEPVEALSPNRQMSILTAIHNLVKKKSQFIIATHSPILLSYPNAIIYKFDETGISKINYEETESFIVSKIFINDYKRMLKILLE